MHLFLEFLPWRFGRILIILGSNHWDWRHNINRLFDRCFLLLFPSHHLLEFILILLSKNTCSLLPLGYKIVRRSRIIKPILFEIRFTLLKVDVIVSVEKVHYFWIYWDLVSANDYSLLFIGLHLIIPRMISNVFDVKSLSGIRVQD